MKRFLFIACGLLLLRGGSPPEAEAQQLPFENKKSQISNVEFYTSNYGIFGLDIARGESGMTVPRGSNKHYLFGSGLWFGAKKPVSTDGGITFEEKSLSFITYNPNSGRSWAVPGEYRNIQPPTTIQPILYHSVEHDRTDGTYNPNPAGGLPVWPLWLRAGETATPFYPGTFTHNQGGFDRPAFMPGVHEQFFSYYHDGDLSQYEIGVEPARTRGYPLGLQIHQNVYAWKKGDLRENVVVLQYEIENVSGENLLDCYAAQILDPDIGQDDNDHVAFYSADPLLHAGLAWSEPEQEDYGTIAIIMLEAPVVDGNGFVDESRRNLFRASGEVHSFRNWVIQMDPRTPEERYQFMSTGSLDSDNGPGDKRILMGTKPFSLRPGDKAHFAIAFAVLEGVTPNGTASGKGNAPQTGAIPELETLAAALHREYYETSFQISSVDEREASVLAAQVLPNPTGGETTIRMRLNERSDVSVNLIDNLGRTVRSITQQSVEAGERTFRLDLADLPNGIYLVAIQAGGERRSIQLNVLR